MGSCSLRLQATPKEIKDIKYNNAYTSVPHLNVLCLFIDNIKYVEQCITTQKK